MNTKKEKRSPCISVCSIEEDIGFCRGCLRSLDEISRWNAYSDADRERILNELEKRRVLYKEHLTSPYST